MKTLERLDRRLDLLEERLPAVPASVLRVERRLAGAAATMTRRGIGAVSDTFRTLSRTGTGAARTVSGTARRAVDDTVDTAQRGARTVAGQARAQSDITGERVEEEVRDLEERVQDRADDIVGAANEVTGADPSTGSPGYEGWTREALYERAQELDIEGRSAMTKDELIDALRRA